MIPGQQNPSNSVIQAIIPRLKDFHQLLLNPPVVSNQSNLLVNLPLLNNKTNKITGDAVLFTVLQLHFFCLAQYRRSTFIYVLVMTLNSSVVLIMTLNWSGTNNILWVWLQFAPPRLIFFVWSYPTCCVASLRAGPVSCISYITCTLFYCSCAVGLM